MKQLLTLLAATAICCSSHAQMVITTVAGNGEGGYSGDGGPAIAATLNSPWDMIKDASGNLLICDAANNCIRMVDHAGIITTIAGTGAAGYNGDGIAASAAQLTYPSSITIDNSGNVYFTDDRNYRVRKIDTHGIITTIAGTGIAGYSGDGGAATAAAVNATFGIVADNKGNVFFDDAANNRIRKIDAAGIITTIAGNGMVAHAGDDGPATAASFFNCGGLAQDTAGNFYVVEHNGNRVRKIDANGIISTIAGTGTGGHTGDGGPATACELNQLFNVSTDKLGNIYIVDGQYIRKINPAGIINRIVGDGIPADYKDGVWATNAHLNTPISVRIDESGSVYIADAGLQRILYVRNPEAIATVDEYADALSVYPNPCNGAAMVLATTATAQELNVTITDVTGREVSRQAGHTNKQMQVMVDGAVGIYLIRAVAGAKTWYARLVKGSE